MRIGIAGAGRIGAYHARTITDLPGVDEVVITDAFPEAAQQAAAAVGATVAPDAGAMLAGGIDALVIAAATNAHAGLIRAGIEAGVPTFCEKPVAATLEESIQLAELERGTDVPVQIGFQRRFDAGYVRVHDAIRSGEVGVVHTIRACTLDTAPPPEAYIKVSGGIFRDCNIHDLDVIRYVSGREVETVYAVGASKGAEYIRNAGDFDTVSALLTLDDGTPVLLTGTRNNSYGHDVRMEVLGSDLDLSVGMNDAMPLVSAEPGITWPAGPTVSDFMLRFKDAYVTELATFLKVARREIPSPCTIADGLQAIRVAAACDISAHEGRIVKVAEIPGGGFAG